MESLAFLVVIILAIALFSGPLALFLTWLPLLNGINTNNALKVLRRIIVTILAVVGSFTSFNLFIAGTTMATTIMGMIGAITAFFAVKREYFPDGFGNGKRRNRFGGWNDRRNGPDGQH